MWSNSNQVRSCRVELKVHCLGGRPYKKPSLPKEQCKKRMAGLAHTVHQATRADLAGGGSGTVSVCTLRSARVFPHFKPHYHVLHITIQIKEAFRRVVSTAMKNYVGRCSRMRLFSSASSVGRSVSIRSRASAFVGSKPVGKRESNRRTGASEIDIQPAGLNC